MTDLQRITAIRARLYQIAGNRSFTNERHVLREELRVLREKLVDELREEGEEEDVPAPPDSVWETLRKIASMEDTLKIMCEDKSIDPKILMSAGFRGAVRLAKQALKDAQKTC
jgi:hypothetical protein